MREIGHFLDTRYPQFLLTYFGRDVRVCIFFFEMLVLSGRRARPSFWKKKKVFILVP